MAKIGEGDERWIVKERSDGANCNNWHWTTKDVTARAKAALTERLSAMKFEPGPLQRCHVTSCDVAG